MRQPSTSAGAVVSLRVRRVDELVDAGRHRRRRRRGRRASARPCRRRAPCLAAVGVDRRRIATAGSGGAPARGTRPRPARRGSARSTGSGRNARIERRCLDERGHVCCHRKRSSCGGRMSSRTEPSPNHDAVEPAHDRDGHARRLAHHQLGGRRDLVGDRDLGDLQLAAERVGRVAQVDDRGDAADADRDVGEALAPGPSERVGDDHRRRRRPARARSASRTCLAERSASTGSSAAQPCVDVRQVDARVRAHEAVRGLADDEVAAAAHDAHRLRLDERAARVEVVGDRAGRGGPRPSTRSSASRRGSRRRRAACPARAPRRRSSSASSSPGRISPMPSIGMTESASRSIRRRRRACRRASAAAISGLRIIVSVTIARTPAASTSAARCASTASITSVPQISRVRARDADARHVDAERRHQPVGRTLHRRAADDRADRRPLARAGRRARRGCRGPRGSARSRSPGSTGRSRSCRRCGAPRARPARAGPRRRRRSAPTPPATRPVRRRTTAASRAPRCAPPRALDGDARAHPVVGHRQRA